MRLALLKGKREEVLAPYLPLPTETEVAIKRIDYELALEELARLIPEERAGVDLWARQRHYDLYHSGIAWGIYGCCLHPVRPTE